MIGNPYTAVGIVQLSGPYAVSIASQVFRPATNKRHPTSSVLNMASLWILVEISWSQCISMVGLMYQPMSLNLGLTANDSAPPARSFQQSPAPVKTRQVKYVPSGCPHEMEKGYGFSSGCSKSGRGLQVSEFSISWLLMLLQRSKKRYLVSIYTCLSEKSRYDYSLFSSVGDLRLGFRTLKVYSLSYLE
ncbi:hypothetical protein KIW84_051130 [Lathyrus oleraceus]|uniref:Uncharacterized protein n=1 Tax=Pisum sativum TaxID=3888 RepID=A0A9D5AFK0_PEA|nr:hypothetical protein KIW84_051130 [Pisum sativum]